MRLPSFTRFIATTSLASLALCASSAGAGTRWSGSASTGIVRSSNWDGAEGFTIGGWAAFAYAASSIWSVGGEWGYFALPGMASVIPEDPWTTQVRMLSGSAVVRLRSGGPLRAHLVGALGYYGQATRERWRGVRPDRLDYEARPGFSIGAGITGNTLVGPLAQVRWHRIMWPGEAAPYHRYGSAVSFEVGLYFN